MDCPATGVTWYGARAYAAWAGVTLPTEAQLEYAFGLSLGADDPPPWRGLLGAVRLWCADTYDDRFYARPAGRDPRNDAAGPFVSVRGSSALRRRDWRPSRREFGTRHEAAPDLGFCCARPAA